MSNGNGMSGGSEGRGSIVWMRNQEKANMNTMQKAWGHGQDAAGEMDEGQTLSGSWAMFRF